MRWKYGGALNKFRASFPRRGKSNSPALSNAFALFLLRRERKSRFPNFRSRPARAVGSSAVNYISGRRVPILGASKRRNRWPRSTCEIAKTISRVSFVARARQKCSSRFKSRRVKDFKSKGPKAKKSREYSEIKPRCKELEVSQEPRDI